MDKGFYLPRGIAEKVTDVTKNAINTNSLNLGLFLDRYILWYKENEKMNVDSTVQVSFLRKTDKSPQDVKRHLADSNISGKKFKEEILKNEKLSIPFKILPSKYYGSYKQRAENLLKELEQIGYSVTYIEPSLNWRLLINLGSSSVYETSLLIHRNYSIPYIPGSTVKGVTRHWTILKFFEEAKCENWEEISCIEKILEISNKEDLKLSFEEFQKKFKVDRKVPSEKLLDFFKSNYEKIEIAQQIFGIQNKKGKVIFFDALPTIEQNKDFIVLDVMNVHYGDYYRDENGKTPPGDWMNPNPVFFLAVEKGTKFKFTIASKNKNLADKAISLLKEAINKIGIGAKTSAGYGYFEG